MFENSIETEKEDKKELYGYQKGDIDAIFERMDNAPKQHHLLYQLPTGGGKNSGVLRDRAPLFVKKREESSCFNA